MLTMDLNHVISHPAFWVVVAACSELIGMSKYKENSVIQLIFTALRTLKGKKN